jgi:iron-sulfur cluster insertion protein
MAMVETEEAPQTGQLVNFCDNAALKVKELIEEEQNDQLMLRVYIEGGGCSGFQYGFTFDQEASEDDFKFVNHGVTLLIDSLSFQYLMNADIDFKEDLEGAHFIIRNPNAKSSCGCGSSFSA